MEKLKCEKRMMIKEWFKVYFVTSMNYEVSTKLRLSSSSLRKLLSTLAYTIHDRILIDSLMLQVYS